jgi:hypothetical protein
MAGIIETIFSGPAFDKYNQIRGDSYVNSPTKFDYDLRSNEAAGQFIQDRTKELLGDNLGSKILGQAATYASVPLALYSSPFHEGLQVVKENRMKPESGIRGFYDAFMKERPFTTALNRAGGVLQSTPLGQNIYNFAGKLADLNLSKTLADSNLSKTLSNSIFTPAYGDIPTKEERQGIESFNNLVSDTVMAEPQIAQTEPAARNNQADILQIINQMEEEKKNYYTQPEEQPDFIDTVLSGLQKGAQYYGGSQIGAGLGSLSGLGPLGFAIGALTGGKFFGGADTSMTPMDRYNQNTFGGYGNMGVQDRYGINTVSLFGDYNRYANRMANKPGPFQSHYQDVVNKQNKQEAQQFADIRQQSESSGGYNPSTGYTAETASGLEGTGGSHHGYSTDYSSPF